MSREHDAESGASANPSTAGLRTGDACTIQVDASGQPVDLRPLRTAQPTTSALVVPRAEVAADLADVLAEVGFSNRELARHLRINESIVRRWLPHPESGAVDKPLPHSFCRVAPDAVAIGLIERTLMARGRSSPLSALQAAVSRLEKGGVADRDRAAAIALHAKLSTLLFGGAR